MQYFSIIQAIMKLPFDRCEMTTYIINVQVVVNILELQPQKNEPQYHFQELRK